MTLLIEYTFIFAIVLFLVALGGCFSEHSGIVNLALEGIMVVGAMGGTVAMKIFDGVPGILFTILVLLFTVLSGMLYSLLLAVPAIKYGADQTLVGTALNIMAVAYATVYIKTQNIIYYGKSDAIIRFINEKECLYLNIFGARVWVYTIIAVVCVVLSIFIMNKTRFGLRLRACGENPYSAASAGVNVQKMRYAGVLISGALGGLGGLAYITASVSEWSFDKGVAGFGFLALAVMIFGQWKPAFIALAAIMFGFFRALSNVYMGIDWLVALNLPGAFYNLMPYVISLLILAFASGKSNCPKAEGQPYP